MSGHLFIVRGNLMRLACDAILVPSGTRRGRVGDVVDPWTSLPLPIDADGYVTPAPSNEQRVVKVASGDAHRPDLWLGHTGDEGRRPDWYAEAAVEFVRQAGSTPIHPDRARPLAHPHPLIGLPLIGTGSGGMEFEKGEVVLALLEGILRELQSVDADVALVLIRRNAYTAVQQARSRLAAGWESVEEFRDTASDLALRARQGRLVLFMGAGTGLGAGLPDWEGLIRGLSDLAEITDDAERSELAALDPRDAGEILDRRLKKKARSLVGAVDKLVSSDYVSLVHQLLASLPVKEAATTNFDMLFERAWDDAGHAHAVLPKGTASEAERWLLKLHGSVEDGQVVLSRDDYLRFEGEGVALAGVVQAMLLTRHMLFVGYSLSDDNFHRLVHQVRRAMGSAQEQPEGLLGTVLTPSTPRLSQEIWGHDLHFVSASDPVEGGVRRLAMLLDLIANEAAAPAAHVLDDAYSAVFSEEELQLRERLRETRVAARQPGVRDAMRLAVEEALDRLSET
jgi:hypothetical protein